MTFADSPSRRDVLRWGVGAFSAALTTAPRNALAAGGRLEIAGNRILSGGLPVRLLGVGVGDPVYVRANRSIDDFRVLADDWNCNSVRISVHPGHWRSEPGSTMAALARDVSAARARGLWVIIDWHAIGFPGRYAEKVDPSWGLILDAFDSDEALAIEFWREMALSFGNDPGILFELWNEPVYDGRLWKSTGQHWPQLKSLWMRLLGVIRRHSDAIVIATGGRWAHDLKGIANDPIDDPRVAYAWHCYPKEDKGLPNRWDDSLGGLQAVKPVLVTEWGFCRSCETHLAGTPADFGEPFVRDALDRYQLHSFAWCYSTGATPQLLNPDETPSEFGAFVKSHLKRAALETRR